MRGDFHRTQRLHAVLCVRQRPARERNGEVIRVVKLEPLALFIGYGSGVGQHFGDAQWRGYGRGRWGGRRGIGGARAAPVACGAGPGLPCCGPHGRTAKVHALEAAPRHDRRINAPGSTLHTLPIRRVEFERVDVVKHEAREQTVGNYAAILQYAGEFGQHGIAARRKPRVVGQRGTVAAAHAHLPAQQVDRFCTAIEEFDPLAAAVGHGLGIGVDFAQIDLRGGWRLRVCRRCMRGPW